MGSNPTVSAIFLSTERLGLAIQSSANFRLCMTEELRCTLILLLSVTGFDSCSVQKYGSLGEWLKPPDCKSGL